MKISEKMYHADGIEISEQASEQIKILERLHFYKLPICISKTQYSFSDDKNLIGTPKNFKIHIKNIKVSAGAGFFVALTGDIMTMPDLPKKPAAENIDIDGNGDIVGIF